jgi:pyridoxine 5-phosphate synthase
MTRLSVNINKIATLRNSRGGNIPDVFKAAQKCEDFGAEGITVHPRPDERHIKYSDVREIRPVLKTEFNIEGYPSEKFMQLVEEVKPDQVTLVPDPPNTLTSNQGWDIEPNLSFLIGVIGRFQKNGIRTSIFIETDTDNIKRAADTGTNRVELYTEPYASQFPIDKEKAVEPFVKAAITADEVGLEINAGHDLNLDNLEYFIHHVPKVQEVSIGHALIADALYFGLEKTINLYLQQLK